MQVSTNYEQNIAGVISPDHILNRLLSTEVNDCDCAQRSRKQIKSSRRYSSRQCIQNLQGSIENLQVTLDAMNHQVIQVENLLSQRDVLYHQLDHLRNQRQQIEDEIQNQEVSVKKTIKIKASRGMKQLNQRLRRRIKEVRDYIEKMDNENRKIQQSISSSQTQYGNFGTYTEYKGGCQPRWMAKMNYQPLQTYCTNKYNREYFDGIKKRLEKKQAQAWQRVRKQEEEIESRNARSLMNFHRSPGIRKTYLSPKFRGY